MTNITNWKITIEIVSLPMNSMVIFYSKMLVITRGYVSPKKDWPGRHGLENPPAMFDDSGGTGSDMSNINREDHKAIVNHN